MSRNDITGDNIISKPITKDYENNYEAIFGKSPKREQYIPDDVKQLPKNDDSIFNI
jgi:hypothetical protein